MPKLSCQENWESWRIKSTALFRHKKRDDNLLHDRPKEAQMIPSPEAVERRNLQIAALYRVCPLATPEIEQNLPVLGPQERRETISEFSKRCEDYGTKNGDLWSFLIMHCEGDAEAEVKNAPTHNGQQAWHKLVTRFGIVTTSTRVTCIKEMCLPCAKATILLQATLPNGRTCCANYAPMPVCHWTLPLKQFCS